ncbi:MAG: acyl-CoA dehydrogenase family protein [Limnohabitans sp.]
MDFDFSDEQMQLRDAVRKWVDKAYDLDERRRIVNEGGFSASVYQSLAELGLTGLYVQEAYGGINMGPVEGMVVMEELGRGMLLEPLSHAWISAAVLQAFAPDDVKHTWLPRIASGETLMVLAHQERGNRYALNRCRTTAEQHPGGWHVSGHKSLVPAGDHAHAYIVPAMAQGQLALFVVPREQGTTAAHNYVSQDGSRMGEVLFQNAPAQLLSLQGLAGLQLGVDVGIAALCAEAVGLMEKTLSITVDYMNTRKQFGVPIAAFQALQHRVADVKMQLELGRSMSYYATLKLNAPADERTLALSRAKWQMGQSMRHVGQEAVQLHGGIGVTDEYIISHCFKRLTQMEMTWGDCLHHLGQVSTHMQDTAGVFA